MRHGWWVACMVVAGVGCGGSTERPAVVFPSKDELQKIAARPAKPANFMQTAAVDHWTIETPVPAPDAKYPEDEVWDRLLVERRMASTSKENHLSPELRCAARESARFYVENKAFPEDALRDYLVMRCGSTMSMVSMRTLTAEAPDDVNDLKLQKAYDESVRNMIAQALGSGTDVGLGFAHGKGRVAFVTLYGTPRGRLAKAPGLVQGTQVTLEGQAAPDAAFVEGFVTQGTLGVARCDADTSVKAPAFRLSCPVLEQDAQARIDVEMLKTGQALMHGALQMLVRKQADAGLTYDGRTYGSTDPAATAAAFRDGVLAGLNAARSEAGARALSLEGNESQDSDSLVSQYFDSTLRGDMADVETVALGLLAGWDVGGTIRQGAFWSQFAPSSRSPGRWVGRTLASPTARWSLLDPQMARVAIGSATLEPSGAMALVTTYSFFDSTDHGSDEDAVFDALVRARRDRGAAPPNRVPSDELLEHVLSRIRINSASAADGAQEVMHHIAYDEHRAARGWYVETSDLKNLPFDESLLGKQAIDVQVGVTHHKAPGGAWGQYVVLISILGRSSDTKEASSGRHEIVAASGANRARSGVPRSASAK